MLHSELTEKIITVNMKFITKWAAAILNRSSEKYMLIELSHLGLKAETQKQGLILNFAKDKVDVKEK